MYVPFLKAKQNELLALRTCSDETYKNLIPFLDIPRPKEVNEVEVESIVCKAKSYVDRLITVRNSVFYLDTFDIPPGVSIHGRHVYEYVLKVFEGFDIIPVIGTDREAEHINAVISSEERFDLVAIRLLADDLLTPNLTISEINELFSEFNTGMAFDLIFDLRLIRELPENTIKNIVTILEHFSNNDRVDNFIITGSIVPPVITDICRPEESHIHKKEEVSIFQSVSSKVSELSLEKLLYGDYTSVSPDYSDSDIPPQLMRTVQAPKIIYSHNDRLFITRGGSLQLKGDDQYFNLAKHVVDSGLWRGKDYSDADKYISDIAMRIPPKCGNASKWINITVCAHLEYYAHFDIAGKRLRLRSA